MNTNFKPLGLAAAVATATVGYAGVTQAASFAGTGLGDAAIVPYYTVQGDYVTGVHITNTSERTQVVKLRFRRALDSMDALDFNVVLSPYDMWTGNIRDVDGVIRVGTADKSCTAPLSVQITGEAQMPDIFREGGEEGYIEIIGMGSTSNPSATNPSATAPQLAIGALHTPLGVPVDCASVESNFFRLATSTPLVTDATTGTKNGVLDDGLTHQTCSEIIGGALNPAWKGCAIEVPGGVQPQVLEDTGNVLNVTYFVRSAETGTEFGSRAVHIADLADGPMMSNQEILISGTEDYFSFLYPDLDGGSPVGTAATRGQFNSVREALGALEIINEWSTNPANGVSTDWVVTMPGQYLMLNLPVYTDSLDGTSACYNAGEAATADLANPLTAPNPICDARDLPVKVDIDYWNREEQTVVAPSGGLVISPATTDTPDAALLPYEVNVIEWSDGTNAPVLDSAFATNVNVAALGSPNGWAKLSVTSDGLVNPTKKTLGIVDYELVGAALPLRATNPFTPVADGGFLVPIVGFAAWERSFANNPAANYGRIIDHAYVSSS